LIPSEHLYYNSSMPIQLLAPDVAAKIAAGEVVERPANVAKELIENSLDATATEIRVEVREGGQRLLRITDNGNGIAADEVVLAFERHATSKLSNAEDLNQIATFGFRGEALYSVAAVSHLTLTTRARHDTDDTSQSAESGVQIHLQGGEIIEQKRAGTPVGTVISVEHLFYNMPARKKFLRKPTTEAGRINAVIQRYALAYPDRRFSFVNEGRLVFQSTGSGDLYDVLVKIYGLDNAKQMVPVGDIITSADRAAAAADNAPSLDDEIDFMDGNQIAIPAASPEEQPMHIVGYASLPSFSRANRNNIDLFINHRYIEDRSLTFAVVQAYHTLLPGGRSPVAVIMVDIEPSQVDVNVHPQKTQVRFYEERRVFSAIQKAVRRAVMANAVIPDMSLPGQAPTWSGNSTTTSSEPTSEWSDRRSNILNAGQRSLDIYIPPNPNPPPLLPRTTPRQAGDEFYIPPMPPPPMPTPTDADAPYFPDSQAQPFKNQSVENSSIEDQPVENQAAHRLAPPEPLSPEQRSPERSIEVEQTSQLPPLRVVGQVGAMYIVTEGPDGLFLIDQHAAHERILYEKYMADRYARLAGDAKDATSAQATQVAQQQLLEPLTLHAGSEMAGLVADHLEELQGIGFEIEPFGGDTFLVRSLPAMLSGQDPLRTLEEIAESLRGNRNLAGEEAEARLVKMVCKRASIKAGQILSDIEMQELVYQLEACQSPRTCPHGRPTMIQLSAGELEKAFGRI